MPETEALMTMPLRLRGGVETLTGTTGATLLYAPASGRYLRIGDATGRLLTYCDGQYTGEDLVHALTGDAGPDARRQAEEKVFALLRTLRDISALEGTGPPPGAPPVRRGRTAGESLPRLRKKFPPGPVRAAAAPLHRALARLGDRGALLLTCATAVLAALAVASLLARHGVPRPGLPLLGAYALLLPAVVVHELCHAAVAERLGVPVRGGGVGLRYGLIPTAFVDTTDAYRLRGRGGRVALCLAGPWCDLVLAGAASAVALGTPDSAPGRIAAAYALLQLAVLAMNLNPLLPSDGQQALEAAAGEINFRGRAMTYLAHLVLRRPRPAFVECLGVGRRRAYLAYGGLSLGYLLLVAAVVAGGLIAAVAHLRR